jgi:integrase
MARNARSAALETRTARLRLAVRRKPYTARVSPSIRLAYRRNQTAGVWSVICADGRGGSWMKKFALADDFEESDGCNVLTFWEAQKQARIIARGGEDGEGDHDRPATVKDALEAYQRDLEGRGGMTEYPRRLRKALPSGVLSKPVALLSAKELAAVRDGWAGEKKPASVNRLAASLKAALNHAASLDERITNAKAWRIGLKAFPDAHVARNVILPDETVRNIVAEAYRLDAAFGLLIEVLAVTGCRTSQAARLDVGDLRGDRLTMPCSAKGRVSKRHNRVPLPIPAGLGARLEQAAVGRLADEPLLTGPRGDRWLSTALRERFASTVKAAGCDTSVTPYALRHSAIVRELLANVPLRIVAATHDTSVPMVERNYSKHIASFSDAVQRRTLLDTDMPVTGDNVVALTRTS